MVFLVIISLAVVLVSWNAVDEPAIRQHIALHFTAPLILTSILVGAALSMSAASLQVLLNNPLADPGMIGISSGASLMAAIVLLTGSAAGITHFQYWLPIACFVGALLSTVFVYQIARRLQHAPIAVILAGIAMSTLTGACIAWLYYFADAQSIRNLTFWLMGSLYQADWSVLAIAGPIIGVALVVLCTSAKSLNQLYLGHKVASASGLDITKLNKLLLLSCAIAVGCAVSIAGSIAFVGLLVPHVLRMLLGHDNRLILPASGMVGALVMLLIALLTEVWSVTTLPVSMLTASIGGPLFIWALVRGQYAAIGNR